MSVTQFAMVEELASLVKDNFPSRHLVLAVEDALVNFLQDDPSSDGILELEPMNSYDRLILHRLADIFGFSHESVGEGDNRHLVLQRCLETSIPSILVSDILWQHDACDSSHAPYQLLRRDGTCSVLKMNSSRSTNFTDREAAYLAARERIFGLDEVELKNGLKEKPRTVPVVARRMIAHALGQRIDSSSPVSTDNARHSNGHTDVHDIERRLKAELDFTTETSPDLSDFLNKSMTSLGANVSGNHSRPTVGHDEKFSCKATNSKFSGAGVRATERNGTASSKVSMRDENIGAAKRMFANALGMQSSKDAPPRSREIRSVME